MATLPAPTIVSNTVTTDTSTASGVTTLAPDVARHGQRQADAARSQARHPAAGIDRPDHGGRAGAADAGLRHSPAWRTCTARPRR
ncbi:MAG: hypothetical protein R2838_20780 [Caldilineaceae bacterium]